MRLSLSHGRLLVIAAIISVPVGLGYGAGIWISQEAQVSRKQQESSSRLKQVSVHAQILLDMVSQEIEILRTHAWGYVQTKTIPTGKILHLAEVELQGQLPGQVKYLAKNPLWNGTPMIEESYLHSALGILNLKEIHQKGMMILRMKKDPSGSSEWLSFAFPSISSEKSVLLALVDPMTAFSSFPKWAGHSSGGRSRSYLISNDGKVLAHSQKTLSASDFSQVPVFQSLIRKALNGPSAGSVTSGAGEFLSFDHMPVDAAFYRLNHSPFALVVEEVNSAQLEKGSPIWIGFLVLMSLTVLMVIISGCALILSSYLVKTVTLTVQAEAQDEFPTFTQPNHTQMASSVQGSKSQPGFFSGDELLILDSMRSSSDDQSL